MRDGPIDPRVSKAVLDSVTEDQWMIARVRRAYRSRRMVIEDTLTLAEEIRHGREEISQHTRRAYLPSR